MMQSALDFRSDLMKQEHCSFTLDITADFGEKVYSFAGQCQYDMEQGGAIALTAPENLAGISASVSLDGAKVEFEDVQLELGQMAEGHVSPMQLPAHPGPVLDAGIYFLRGQGRRRENSGSLYQRLWRRPASGVHLAGGADAEAGLLRGVLQRRAGAAGGYF